MPSKKQPTDQVVFQVDAGLHRRFEEICDAKHVEVPEAMRMMLAKAVRMGTFDWLPLDGTDPDHGYMPYVLIKEMIEGASWNPSGTSRRSRGRTTR
ncbi:hypothetical protein [Variovorax sp. LjRoot175]|uniref:hypothetical protein n=1 Tax=Variovorax sp. LjRoot175 TaxID=3342276 RepID=UPI003F50E75F